MTHGTSSAPGLISMTGHGDALVQNGDVSVSVELRSVNHRHFKLLLRSTELTPAMESRIESLVRESIQRGSVSVSLRILHGAAGERFRLHIPTIRNYCRQLASEFGEESVQGAVLGAILSLPGVIDESSQAGDVTDHEWPVVEKAMREALERLQAMRIAEGTTMAHDLTQNCQEILGYLDRITNRAPLVVDAYRRRIQDRVQRMLAEQDVSIAAADIVREVALFADRCDISEELVRLRSHTEQFLAATTASGANGRKLDFITQEMFREANTIGSKSNDVEIAQGVVELKNRIEKMREMVQNIE